jgi:hypothetical protein
MEIKQRTIAEIAETERLLLAHARERYPVYYPHALEASLFLSNFIKSVDPDRSVFVMFLSQLKKHHTLALFSTVRLHQIQAKMNLRQVLEAGACAAFAIATPGDENFVDTDEQGILESSQALAKKRYDWLDKHYPAGSEAIKTMKANINESAAHANLVSTHRNFRFNVDDGSFEAPFFDMEDEYFVKTDLWMISRIAVILMETFYGVNQGRNVIKFADDFLPRFEKLAGDNRLLHGEMTATERHKKAQQKILERARSPRR